MIYTYISRSRLAKIRRNPTGALPKGQRIPYDPPVSSIRLAFGVCRSLVRMAATLAWVGYTFAVIAWTIPVDFISPALYRRIRRRLIKTMARGLLLIFGVVVSRRGYPPTGPAFFTSNHLSWLDIVVYGAEFSAVFVAMERISRWPVIGTIARTAGSVFIDRSKLRDIEPVNKAIRLRLESGDIIAVFCESTVSNGVGILPIRSSLLLYPAATGTSVHYAALGYHISERWGHASDSICWIDWTPFLLFVLRMLRIPRINAKIMYDCTLIPSKNRKVLAADLETRIRSLHATLSSP